MAQASRRIALSAAVVALSCTSTTTTVPAGPAVADPTVAMRVFMEAVQAKDLNAMGELWGTENGVATARMSGNELQQRLTVMQIYLEHESYEVLPPNPAQTLGAPKHERHFRLRLSRNNCRPEVPVTMVPYRAGWLVKSIDLAAAGNPERTC